MKKEKDLKNYRIRTDLVIDNLNDERLKQKETTQYKDIYINDIVLEKDLENKKKGHYLTIHFKDVTDFNNRNNLTEILTEKLKAILKEKNISKDKIGLIVGLGNSKSTPDSLGPLVIEKIIVTKYLFDLGEIVSENFSNIASIIPGVSGNTGLDSQNIIKGIINECQIDYIIVVDALASSSLERVNKTIQITDTGISPGSGVGNTRLELSYDTLGIPVIAIGIPTVVDLPTIVDDTLRYLMMQISYHKDNMLNNKNKMIPINKRNYLTYQEELSPEEKKKLLGTVGTISNEQRKILINEVLTPVGFNMMVTPKEIDFIIEKLSDVISNSLNNALHDLSSTKK